MLDVTTKRKIDAARNVLVGKVPDPKAQVEQITTALIYKFMDDLDKDSIELGGEAKFFTGEFYKFSWSRVVDTRLTGEGRLDLYVQAITNMSKNPNLPQLFRDIFKGAYLPYNDPQTLSLFLKEINKFTYDHSEELGNAFEYLLSVLGSQGDAGQFRTPRHIIDFIVEVINPKKNETILDPACGTAGFLISSYKHIRKNNSSNYNPNKEDEIIVGYSAAEVIVQENQIYTGDNLTPTERKNIMQNIQGYDISPDMVRLSLVNLYLHGFSSPKIFEYDSLTSEKRWGESFDVILANPPFMTPKGGIRPHKRFQVQANRAEVLFVDYIFEHLNINGRAGIIVPDGIIFQNGKSYVKLRKLLVENYLVAVISLPMGVFNPYSAVKTSILIFDKALARKKKTVAFFKVENDGYDLGAQRREISKNDLPQVLREITIYFQYLQQNKSVDELIFEFGHIVNKDVISSNGTFNLTGDRYIKKTVENSKWPMVPLGSVITIESGSRQKGGAIESGIPSIGGEQIDEKGNIRFNKMRYVSEQHFRSMKKGILQKNDVLIVKDGATTGKIGFYPYDNQAAINEHVYLLRAKENIHPYYLLYVVRARSFQDKLKPFIKGIIGGISREFANITIPVPPMDIQEKIVAEVEMHRDEISQLQKMIVKEEARIELFFSKLWGEKE